jgi:hypothetical protein
LILAIPKVAQLAKGRSYKHLRLRELKRDYMFGAVLREHEKTLKQNNLSDCSMVLQILDKEEQLNEEDIVLIVKSRDS